MHRPAPPTIPRRDFIKATGAAVAGALAGASAPSLRPAAAQIARPRRARNLIFMAADGMSTGSLVLGDLYLRERYRRRHRWLELMRRPGAHRALVETASADGHVPDSAASATAWSIGERANNGAICFTPDGRTPAPLFLRAKQRGSAVGLVTNTRIPDATLACFLANSPSRTLESEIAAQLLARSADVVLGGGAALFPDSLLQSRPDMRLVRGRDALLALETAAPPAALLGLFAPAHMSYALDRPDTEPTLAEMTAAALRSLRAAPNGFVLCIEGARIDHAAHANDAGALVTELAAFDEALALVIDHCDTDPETLLILTTDHANANPGLATSGPDGARQFARIQTVTRSFEWILARFDALPSPDRSGDALGALVLEATGVTITAEETAILHRWRRGERVDPYTRANNQSSPLGSVLANHLGVAFTGPSHTSDFVECLALGPGADRLAPIVGIEEIHHVAAAALDLPPA